MEKLKNQFTINLNDEDAQKLKALANYYNRKPCEILRLLAQPQILKEFIKMNCELYPENKNTPQKAIFKKETF